MLVTSTTLLPSPTTQVRGLVNGPVSLGEAPFEVLRFSLANFPGYIGTAYRLGEGPHSGFNLGRLRVQTDSGECVLDEVM